MDMFGLIMCNYGSEWIKEWVIMDMNRLKNELLWINACTIMDMNVLKNI